MAGEVSWSIDPRPRFVGAVAVVVVRKACVLALKRDTRRDVGAGLWEVVSGRVEADESLLEAAQRELLEETGLEAPVDPVPVDAYRMFRGDEPMILVVYRAIHEGEAVPVLSEHERFAWWTPEEFRRHSTLTRLAEAVDRAVARPYP